MKLKYQIPLTALIVLTILCAAFIPGMGSVSTLIHYASTCCGFTDGSWPCPSGEIISNQISYMVFLSLPLLFLLLTGWMVTLFFWILSRFNKRFSPRIQSVTQWAAVILLGLTSLLITCYSLLIGIPLLMNLFPN